MVHSFASRLSIGGVANTKERELALLVSRCMVVSSTTIGLSGSLLSPRPAFHLQCPHSHAGRCSCSCAPSGRWEPCRRKDMSVVTWLAKLAVCKAQPCLCFSACLWKHLPSPGRRSMVGPAYAGLARCRPLCRRTQRANSHTCERSRRSIWLPCLQRASALSADYVAKRSCPNLMQLRVQQGTRGSKHLGCCSLICRGMQCLGVLAFLGIPSGNGTRANHKGEGLRIKQYMESM